MHVVFVPSWYCNPHDLTRGSFFREQAHCLAKAGYQVGVIAPQFRSLRKLRKGLRGVPRGIEYWQDGPVNTLIYHRWGWASKLGRLYFKQWIQSGQRLMQAYIERHGRPDVLHAHSALYGGVIAQQLSQQYDIPLVITEHSSRFGRKLNAPWQQQAATQTFNHASARLAVGSELARLLNQNIAGLDGEFDYVPNVVDPMFVPAAASNPESEKAERKFRFLSVGALKANKGHALLIEAWHASNLANQAELRIIGEGPELGCLQAQIQQLGLQTSVKLLGQQPRETVLHEMQACDTFVLASYYETFGVVLIEALACGKPVLSSACGGPNDIVNTENGRFFPPGNQAELSAGLRHFVSHLAQYNSAKISHDCRQRFGEQALVQNLNTVYSRVAKSQARSLCRGVA